MVTPYQIPEKYLDDVTVYVAVEQKQEYIQHNPKLRIKSVSTMDDKLGKKLALMAADVEDDLVMLCDDDFVFFRRIDIDEAGLRKMEEDDWHDLFTDIHNIFELGDDIYAVGVSMRQGNNRLEADGAQNTRLNGCIIYRRDMFLSVEHDRVNPMNDFDVNLQLLRQGYTNHLISEFCYNQGGTNAPGGSSDYRTLETQAESAHKLAELHPGFVKIRQKVNKTGDIRLRERTEVTVYWKKAQQSAK